MEAADERKTTMKRLLISCLALLVLPFALTACSSPSGESDDLIPTPAPEPAPGDPGFLEEPESSEEPAPEPCVFHTDRYIVSQDAAEYLGNARADYEALIDTICAGETSLVIEDIDSAEKAVAVFEESPYRAFAEPTLTDDAIQITYSKTGSADAFDEAATYVVESAVYSESNTLETALGLYRAVSSGFIFEENEENSLYRMMTEKKGSTAEFAAALNYLFNQNGIESRLASGTADDTHFWVVAELDGQLYHFDPTFENGATGGAGLSYFGMSDDTRVYTGCALPFTTGRGDYAETHDALCTDTKFDTLFTDVTGWECDVRAHFLYLAYGFEEDYLTSVSTDTFTAAAG